MAEVTITHEDGGDRGRYLAEVAGSVETGHLDWEARGAEIESELSSIDGGIHLNSGAARTFYTHLILEALGLA